MSTGDATPTPATSPTFDAKSLGTAEIAFLDWLARSPGTRALHHMHGIGTDGGSWHFMVSQDPRSPYASLEGDGLAEATSHVLGRRTPDLGRMLRLGFVTRQSGPEFAERYGRPASSFRSTSYRVARAGHAWWKVEGRSRYEDIVARAERSRALVSRRIAIGSVLEIAADLPQGYRTPVRRITFATHTAEVVRETEKRLYVIDVTTLFVPPIHVRNPVEGRRPNLYVDRSAVMFDGITPGQARRIADGEREHWDEMQAIHARYVEEVSEAMRRMEDRFRQKAAERLDDLEALLTPRDADPAADGP